MSYPNILFGPEGLQYKSSTNVKHSLGQMLVMEDGRRFRYAKNGAAAATPGLLFQSGVSLSSAVSSLTIGALAAGDKTLTFTTAFTTTLAAGIFNEGYAITVSSVAGGGQTFKIDTQPALTCAVSTNTITLTYGVPAAITSSVMVSLHRNPYSAVIVHPSPPTAQVVGWTMSCIVASGYGWLGTAGVLAGLVDRDPQMYQGVTPSTALNGAVNQAYLRVQAGTSAVVFTSGAPTSLTFDLAGSTGADAAIGVFATSSAIASAAGTAHDVGMQQVQVGYAISTGLTSGSYGAIFATLDG